MIYFISLRVILVIFNNSNNWSALYSWNFQSCNQRSTLVSFWWPISSISRERSPETVQSSCLKRTLDKKLYNNYNYILKIYRKETKREVKKNLSIEAQCRLKQKNKKTIEIHARIQNLKNSRHSYGLDVEIPNDKIFF